MRSIYNIDFALGQMLVEADDEKEALAWARNEYGRHGAPYKVDVATDDNIAYVKSMGGRIHKTPRSRSSVDAGVLA